jgi:hypothetical protein
MERIITMEEVVANAATIIPKEDREARNLMRQWAYLGARELLSNKADIDVQEIIPDGNLVCLKPTYFLRAKDISVFDASGSELKYRFQPYSKERIHINKRWNYRDDASYPMITISEDVDSYILDSFYGDSVAQLFLRYYKLPIDPDTDEPYFYSEQLLALMMFIRWMYFLRQGNMGQAGMAEKTWMKEQHKVKVKNKMPTELEAKEIAKGWNSMIQKKFYNTF